MILFSAENESYQPAIKREFAEMYENTFPVNCLKPR